MYIPDGDNQPLFGDCLWEQEEAPWWPNNRQRAQIRLACDWKQRLEHSTHLSVVGCDNGDCTVHPFHLDLLACVVLAHQDVFT